MINENVYFSVIAGVAICFSLVSCVLSVLALAYVIGLKNSTHKIEWVPVDQKENEKFIEKEVEDEN
jgi:hypothetical protein